MSSLWDVPQYLIMAFSLAFAGPVEKASRVPRDGHPGHGSIEISRARTADDLLDETAWLRAVKTASPSSDILALYGARIFQTSSGRYYAATQAERAEILALRNNEEIAARVMAAATLQLSNKFASVTGVRPTRSALLIAHVAGLDAAVAYSRALVHDASARAAAAVPALVPKLGAARTMTLAALDARIEANLLLEVAGRETSIVQAETTEPLKGTLTAGDAVISSRLADTR